MLDRGAAVDAVDVDGVTALMLASNRGHLQTARCLVERGGANVSAARSTDGMTALMWASRECNLKAVRYLVGLAGTNVNATRTTDGVTALMLASGSVDLEILETVRLLLKHGADRLVADAAGRTAHFYAAAHPLVQAALV